VTFFQAECREFESPLPLHSEPNLEALAEMQGLLS